MFLILQENDLIKMLRKISKFMMSQTTTQTITINVLPDISKSNRQSNNEIWTVDRI